MHIGKDVKIGHNVTIRTTSKKNKPGQDVKIHDNVWLGNNVFVCQGVTIGTNATIGANSVVTHNVPADETWAGCPARKIK